MFSRFIRSAARPLVAVAAIVPLPPRAALAQQPDANATGILRANSRSTYVHRITLYDHDGVAISPQDEPAKPYSPRATCGKCHEYASISHGWHFNAASAGAADPGRPGEPWIYVDPVSGSQIPLSYRGWAGTYRPDEAGLSDWRYVLTFGRHVPGGVDGEPGAQALDGADPAQTTGRRPFHRQAGAAPSRWSITGPLEIDCMLCHGADNRHDPTEAARQIEVQNFRWAPTAALGLGVVRGDTRRLPDDWDPDAPVHPDRPDLAGPKVIYDATRFDPDERVFFDITRRPPVERCYSCHSATPVGGLSAEGPAAPQRFEQQGDVHLAAGLTCTDCHRNGIDHDIVRGFDDEVSANPLAGVLTCRGCHLGDDAARDAATALGGRLRAPHPQHRGIPPLHFEKLTCTACHSGPWPQSAAQTFQTSMAHGLGLALRDRREDAPPIIAAPVFARVGDGPIAPHRLIWPAFWGVEQGSAISPLPLDLVRRVANRILPERTVKAQGPLGGAAPTVSSPALEMGSEQIAAVLGALAEDPRAGGGRPVFVHDGVVDRRSADGRIERSSHPQAAPYLWALAHDVRPAAQSLGVRGCTDCHAASAAFFYGSTTPVLPADRGVAAARTMPEGARRMHEMMRYDPLVAGAFGWVVWAQPALKWLGWLCLAVLAAVLARYAALALDGVLRWAGSRP